MTADWPSLGFRVWRQTPGPMAADHAHADIEVNYLEQGEIRYLLAGAWRTFHAGQVVAFWAALPHHLVEVRGGARGIWLTVPLGWFLGQESARGLVDALLTRPLVDARPGDGPLFAAWADAWERPTPTAERIVRLEVEARLLRLTPVVADGAGEGAAGIVAHPGEADPVAGDAPVDRAVAAMVGVMARHHVETLTVDDIATPTGLHPRYAMTRFKQALGITVWEYLLRLRVAAAQRCLLTSDQDLLAVAYASGFGSPARFHATFKRITGMTPRAYRLRHGR